MRGENREEEKKVRTWIEDYGCGCSATFYDKNDLPGYCEKHGNDVREVIFTWSVPVYPLFDIP